MKHWQEKEAMYLFQILGIIEQIGFTGDAEESMERYARQGMLKSALNRLSESNSEDILNQLALNQGVPRPILQKLSLHENINVVRSVARNEMCPSDIFYNLLRTEEDLIVHGFIALNKSCPVAILEELAESEANSVRAKVAKSDHSSNIVFERLLQQPITGSIAKNLASNPKCPTFALEQLLETEVGDKLEIQCYVLTNPNITKEMFWKLVHTGAEKLLQFAPLSQYCPNSLLEELSVSANSSIRAGVASSLKVSTELLWNLSADEDWVVRKAVASNPRCPTEVLHSLTSNVELYVLSAVAQNQNSGVSVFRQMMKSENTFEVQLDAVFNPNCPEFLLNHWSDDESVDIVSHVARHKNATEATLWKISKSKHAKHRSIQRIIASSPICPSELLEQYANSNDEEIAMRALFNQRCCHSQNHKRINCRLNNLSSDCIK